MPTAKNAKVTPRTPGENVPAKQMPPQETVDTSQASVDPGENVVATNTPEALEGVEFSEEQLAAIDAMFEAKMAKAKAASKKPQPAKQLPDQSEIDAREIDRAVMTKQGWVCPLETAADKARREKGLGGN